MGLPCDEANGITREFPRPFSIGRRCIVSQGCRQDEAVDDTVDSNPCQALWSIASAAQRCARRTAEMPPRIPAYAWVCLVRRRARRWRNAPWETHSGALLHAHHANPLPPFRGMRLWKCCGTALFRSSHRQSSMFTATAKCPSLPDHDTLVRLFANQFPHDVAGDGTKE